MKKILLVAATLLLTFSMAFGARKTGMDLLDIFGANQVGLGYVSDEFDTRLYSDFGTDKLRFSVNVLELGSFYNNGQQVDGTGKVGMYGLPRFFVGAGYNMGAHRFALGYGLKKVWEEVNGRPGWVGHDISLAWQGNFGANTFKFATPIEIGAGTGRKDTGNVDGAGDKIYYTNKDISALAIAPQIRWLGKLGPLVQIRFKVPYGSFVAKKADMDDTGKEIDLKGSSVGADLRVYFQVATDPVNIQFVPRVIYQTAIKGNSYGVTAMGGSPYEDVITFTHNKDYNLEMPWRVDTILELSMSAGNDIVDVWLGPALKFTAIGAPKIIYTDGAGTEIRKEAFYGLGFYLPIELTFKINKNLNVNIGMEAEGDYMQGIASTAFKPNGSVGGSVVWYF